MKRIKKNYVFSIIGVILIFVGSVVPTCFLLINKERTNVASKYLDIGFEDFQNEQDEINNSFKDEFKIDYLKYKAITNDDISYLISNFYNELYSPKRKNDSDLFINISDKIDVKYKIDSYIRKQKKEFIKEPTANIDIKFKKNRFISNNYLIFIKIMRLILIMLNNNALDKIDNLNNNVNVNKIISFIEYSYVSTVFNALNNNYNNSYKVNVSDFLVSLDKVYVGSLIVAPMYADKINWKINNFVIDRIDTSFITNIIKKPLDLIYNFLNDKWKNIINNLFDIFSYSSTLSPLLNFDKLLPIIKINDPSKINVKSINFGNFSIFQWKAEDDALYISSNNPAVTSISMKKSSCLGPKCSHNHVGFNKIFANFIKWALTMIGSDGFYDIALILIKLILPLLSGVTIFMPFISLFLSSITLLLNIANNIIEEIYHYIEMKFDEIFKKLFDYENFSFKEIFDKLFRTLINVLNDNVYDIAMKYAGTLPYHGFDVGECSTALVNLKIDTKNKKIPLRNDEYYLYGSNKSNNIISPLFDINNNKIVFDKDIIISIFELSNYSNFFDFISNDKQLPNHILKIFAKNIYNLSVPSSGLYKQYLEYKNSGIIPKIYYKKLPYFQSFLSKGFIINNKIEINDFKLLKEQILSDLIYQNIYFNANGKKYKLFDKGKLLDVYVDKNIVEFNKRNYIYIDFKEIGNKLN